MLAAAVDGLGELETDSDSLGASPRIIASTFKAVDFWPFNPSVGGRGGSGQGRRSVMPRECTWITAREEACSKGGGGVLDIQILGANVFDNQLAREEVFGTIFLGVGVRTRLLWATVESINGGE
jgi:hypothetical protein